MSETKIALGNHLQTLDKQNRTVEVTLSTGETKKGQIIKEYDCIKLVDRLSGNSHIIPLEYIACISYHVPTPYEKQVIAITEEFVEHGYQISHTAIEEVCMYPNPSKLTSYILENIDESIFLVELDSIRHYTDMLRKVNHENLKKAERGIKG